MVEARGESTRVAEETPAYAKQQKKSQKEIDRQKEGESKSKINIRCWVMLMGGGQR